MERRYDLFASVNARNIKSYNEFVKDYNNGKSDSEQKEILSYHVIILDEVADLMMVASKDYEDKYVNAKATSSNSSSGDDYDDGDEEYEMCREFVIQAQKASTSLLQRKFRIGYNKAARIIDQLEEDGVIGPQLGSKPREVFIRQYHEEDL